jgi:NADPH:quinone reductase-like Zn-dependent oxidoreductase
MIQATQFTGYQALVQLDAPKPQIADGRVLVRVTAAGVTPLDHTILSGGHPRAKAPLVLGNEGAGVIEDAGASGLVPGSRVAFTGGYGVAENGSWEDYVTVRTDDLLPIPDGIDDVLAAGLPVAYMTARIALDDAGFAAGKTVFTPAIGGSVGNATYQLAKALGAATVISTAGNSVKATQARDHGYADIIDLSAENIGDGDREPWGRVYRGRSQFTGGRWHACYDRLYRRAQSRHRCNRPHLEARADGRIRAHCADARREAESLGTGYGDHRSRRGGAGRRADLSA